jgi:pimeloyl-ACP methyl ester carboxylesterase
MTNKIYFFIMILVGLSKVGESQSWYSFSTKLAIDKYIGSQFRLEASVRANIDDASASARIWLRIDDVNGNNAFLENMWNKPIRNAKWYTYSIEGIINENAANVAFGSISQYSGTFYYDNFKLSVKGKDGIWKQIYKMDFENGLDGWKAGTTNNSRSDTNSFFIATVDKDVLEGDHCLKIVGKNIPNYGSNKKIGKYAKVNGINLYYEIYGTGKPLVILHGNGGSIEDAEQHISFFKDKYQVIAIDSRGQGNSLDDTTKLTYNLMASDVNALLEQLHIDSAYIWGHSDGAIEALILAMDYPKKVKKAIAYAANLTPDTSALTSATYNEIVTKSKSLDFKERQLNTLMLDYPHISFSDLHKIEAEILVMSGDNDDIPLSHSLEIYKNIKKSNLCVIPGATHYGAFRKPKLFQEIAIDFFEKPFKK